MTTEQRLANLRANYIATYYGDDNKERAAAWWDENKGDLKTLGKKVNHQGDVNNKAGHPGVADCLWGISNALHELAD